MSRKLCVCGRVCARFFTTLCSSGTNAGKLARGFGSFGGWSVFGCGVGEPTSHSDAGSVMGLVWSRLCLGVGVKS